MISITRRGVGLMRMSPKLLVGSMILESADPGGYRVASVL